MHTYGERAQKAKHPLAKRLLQLMEKKATNLGLSVDVLYKADLLMLAEQLGPYICVLKTHIDIIKDFDQDLIVQLQKLSTKYQFIIFEDRKFADIGNTVKHQYGNGIYRIAEWADMVNAHILPGPGIIEGLRDVGQPKGRGLLLLAQMSSLGNLLTAEYTRTAAAWAARYDDFVMGFISQTKISDAPGMLHFNPGVKLEAGGDDLGQNYITPHAAITQGGADVILVGRGIYSSPDPLASAKHYQQAGWESYRALLG